MAEQINLEEYKYKIYSYDKFDADSNEGYDYTLAGMYKKLEDAKKSIENRKQKEVNELTGYHIFDKNNEIVL